MLTNFSMFGSGVEVEGTRFETMGLNTLAMVFGRYFKQVKYGGSNQGVMNNFAAAFAEQGGEVMGIYPKTLADLGYVAHYNYSVSVDDLSERKQRLLEDIDAILCLPGGFGTMDEIFTYLAQVSFRETDKVIPIFFYDYEGYYRPLELMFQVMNESGALNLAHFKLHFLETMDAFDAQLKLLESSLATERA